MTVSHGKSWKNTRARLSGFSECGDSTPRCGWWGLSSSKIQTLPVCHVGAVSSISAADEGQGWSALCCSTWRCKTGLFMKLSNFNLIIPIYNSLINANDIIMKTPFLPFWLVALRKQPGTLLDHSKRLPEASGLMRWPCFPEALRATESDSLTPQAAPLNHFEIRTALQREQANSGFGDPQLPHLRGFWMSKSQVPWMCCKNPTSKADTPLALLWTLHFNNLTHCDDANGWMWRFFQS